MITLNPQEIEIVGVNQDNEKLAKCKKCNQEFFIVGDEWNGYYTEEHECK